MVQATVLKQATSKEQVNHLKYDDKLRLPAEDERQPREGAGAPARGREPAEELLGRGHRPHVLRTYGSRVRRRLAERQGAQLGSRVPPGQHDRTAHLFLLHSGPKPYKQGALRNRPIRLLLAAEFLEKQLTEPSPEFI